MANPPVASATDASSDDNWNGGYCELAIKLGEHDDARLDAALNSLWEAVGLPRAFRRSAGGPAAELTRVSAESLLAIHSVPLVSAVATPSSAYPITAPVLGLRLTREELMAFSSEDIVEAVQSASPKQRRGLAAWATRRAIARADLTDLPQLAPMLSQLEQPAATRFTPEASAFRATADRNSNAAGWALSVEGDHDLADALKHWHAKSGAMEALAYTAASDDITAALGATYCASIPYRDSSDDYEPFITEAINALNA